MGAQPRCRDRADAWNTFRLDGPRTVAKGNEDQRGVPVAWRPSLAAAIGFFTSCGVRYPRLRDFQDDDSRWLLQSSN
jgi:hypothetical protein